MKAWAFTFDGHIFYVMDDVDGDTLVCDLRTEQWHHWYAGADPGLWDMRNGIMWNGLVLASDLETNQVWEMDPHSMRDQGATEISRVVTGFSFLRGRASQRVGSFRLTASVGEPSLEDAEVTLRFSDDEGQTWGVLYTRVLEADNFAQVLRYRSLGRIRAPGRIWEIADRGGLVLIEGADADIEGME